MSTRLAADPDDDDSLALAGAHAVGYRLNLTTAQVAAPTAAASRPQVRRVRVTLDLTGLAGSDPAYQPGPNGWTYRLERDSATQPWQITDHGNG